MADAERHPELARSLRRLAEVEGRRALHRDGRTDSFDKLEELISARP